MAVATPLAVHFEGEEEGEKVLFLLRAHPITNLRWVLIVLVLVLVPPLLNSADIEVLLNLKFNNQTVFLATALWYLVVLGYAFQEALHWYFNIYILTNKRIVDIDFYGLFYRSISQTTLPNVQDITFSKGGIFQNFFDYGDIHIQTAGTATNFEFASIPDPEGVQKKILDLIARKKRGEL